MINLSKSPDLCNSDRSAKQNGNRLQVSVEEIKSLSTFFSTLIDTIPAKIYFSKNEDILEKIEFNKQIKFDDSSLSKRSKNKRIKLDPSSQQRISDIATAFYDKKKNESKVNELRKKLQKRIRELREARGVNGDAASVSSKSDCSVLSSQSNEPSSSKGPKIFNKEGKLLNSIITLTNLSIAGNLVFSKFDFASQVDVAAENEMQKKKEKKKDSLKGLLMKAKKEENKLARLEATNVPAANRMKEKLLWKSALEKAEGNKVKDSSKLLEKTLKKKMKQKKKSAKAWSERTAGVEKRKERKQEKRARHLDERKQAKKEKKRKLLRKKGRILN